MTIAMTEEKRMKKTTVDIHGTKWKVEKVKGIKIDKKQEDVTYLGRTYYGKHLIRMRKGLDRVNAVQTMRHELTHAMLFEYGISLSDEESICNFIGAFAEEITDKANRLVKELGYV